MTAVTFDTLKLARRLEGAGFTRDQADGAAEALAESFSAEIATKGDLADLRMALESRITGVETATQASIASLNSEIGALRTEIGAAKADIVTVRAEIATVRSDLKSDMASLKSEIKTDLAALKSEIKSDTASLKTATAQWIISAVLVNMLGMLGAVAAVWQLARQ